MEREWFEVVELEPGVHAIGESLHDENVACFLVEGRDRAALIDAGTGIGDLRGLVEELTSLPLTLVISHSHWDHVGSVSRFSGWAEVLVHPLEASRLRAGVPNERMRSYVGGDHLRGAPPAGLDLDRIEITGVDPDGYLDDGSIVDLGGRTLEVLHVPGHSPGLLALLDRDSGALFTTDAVYGGSLYAHLPGVDFPGYVETARRLGALEPEIRNVYPSHNERRLEPAILGRVDRAFREVADGRRPDAIEGEVARHRFDGFSILRPAGTPT